MAHRWKDCAMRPRGSAPNGCLTASTRNRARRWSTRQWTPLWTICAAQTTHRQQRTNSQCHLPAILSSYPFLCSLEVGTPTGGPMDHGSCSGVPLGALHAEAQSDRSSILPGLLYMPDAGYCERISHCLIYARLAALTDIRRCCGARIGVMPGLEI